eukprot:TRINITY_DN17150_c0_g1_i3.p1 TRINITY_DN17150_c0_g1~~TRINITY_DN17150_c0_g1_i3.p1  ORF type:complete len:105 (+),score=14.79 TRINITY_DN17150_c0_g1_i3:148-462(+)
MCIRDRHKDAHAAVCVAALFEYSKLHELPHLILLQRLALQERSLPVRALPFFSTEHSTCRSCQDTCDRFGLLDALEVIGPPCSCLLYTSPSPRDRTRSRMPSSA